MFPPARLCLIRTASRTRLTCFPASRGPDRVQVPARGGCERSGTPKFPPAFRRRSITGSTLLDASAQPSARPTIPSRRSLLAQTLSPCAVPTPNRCRSLGYTYKIIRLARRALASRESRLARKYYLVGRHGGRATLLKEFHETTRVEWRYLITRR